MEGSSSTGGPSAWARGIGWERAVEVEATPIAQESCYSRVKSGWSTGEGLRLCRGDWLERAVEVEATAIAQESAAAQGWRAVRPQGGASACARGIG